ncbi:sensor histidine kinase [Euzebya tangerina]|uniref:sensor histidine kinase n=1 Tax=Euzebya tangerina TaxID=591198 RepID=UPI000E30CB4D|nr:HAMP domain-containing sensor histidine kinase [Euzebya tangerina]
MTYRRRLVAFVATSLAATVALSGAVGWVVARQTMLGAVDEGLITTVETLRQSEFGRVVPFRQPSEVPPVLPTELVPIGVVSVRRGGRVLFVAGNQDVALPAVPSSPSVADAPLLETVAGERTTMRVVTAAVTDDVVLQVGRPIDDVQAGLTRLAWIVSGLTVLGAGLGIGLGRLIADRAVTPLARVASAAEHVADTGQLTAHLPVESAGEDDELVVLAASFNRMLDRLAESRRAQHLLVADASHELRTPVAAVRANVELLRRLPEDDPDRHALMDTTIGQLDALAALVSQLVDLARHQGQEPPFAPFRLDDVIADAIAQVHTFDPDAVITADLRPVTVTGAPDRVRAAVVNLLDNALRHGEPPVEVMVDDRQLRVTDSGAGVDPADLTHLFEEFWRAPEARRRPGSGLGLALVAQVAAGHRWTVEASNDGGLSLCLTFDDAGDGGWRSATESP